MLVGGKQVALKIHDRTIPVPLEKESQSVPDTANPALHVNTLLREVHEGVMTLLERTAPKPTKQPARKATEKKEGPPPAESVDPGNDSGSFTDF
ncbi:MAG TPA: hypothetical protein DIT13_04965 [Verrucomicrobiales bacterium]|nr:hypothetical protein [Verrucomicrobiales bacterium]